MLHYIHENKTNRFLLDVGEVHFTHFPQTSITISALVYSSLQSLHNTTVSVSEMKPERKHAQNTHSDH